MLYFGRLINPTQLNYVSFSDKLLNVEKVSIFVEKCIFFYSSSLSSFPFIATEEEMHKISTELVFWSSLETSEFMHYLKTQHLKMEFSAMTEWLWINCFKKTWLLTPFWRAAWEGRWRGMISETRSPQNDPERLEPGAKESPKAHRQGPQSGRRLGMSGNGLLWGRNLLAPTPQSSGLDTFEENGADVTGRVLVCGTHWQQLGAREPSESSPGRAPTASQHPETPRLHTHPLAITQPHIARLARSTDLGVFWSVPNVTYVFQHAHYPIIQ